MFDRSDERDDEKWDRRSIVQKSRDFAFERKIRKKYVESKKSSNRIRDEY